MRSAKEARRRYVRSDLGTTPTMRSRDWRIKRTTCMVQRRWFTYASSVSATLWSHVITSTNNAQSCRAGAVSRFDNVQAMSALFRRCDGSKRRAVKFLATTIVAQKYTSCLVRIHQSFDVRHVVCRIKLAAPTQSVFIVLPSP